MPSTPTTAWEGHGPMAGVDTRTHPAQLTPQFATGAVNRTFRGGQNSTRPSIQQKRLLFKTEEEEEAFKFGNVAGAHAYQKTLSKTQPHLVLAVGDKILKGRMFGDAIEFSTLYDLSSPEFMHMWFVQCVDRLYAQNGQDDPLGWDGKTDMAYEISGGLAADRMPVGTIMAYIHGRVVVFTAENQALASDHIYGNGLQQTNGVEIFTEAQNINDIGAFVTPADLDAITGVIPIPRTPNKDAQGDLLVMTKQGGYTIRLTGIRSEWLISDIQQIVMTGVGGASHTALTPANNDIWFRTSQGNISSYKFERSEQERTWGDTSLSREVSDYLRFDSPRNLQFSSSILAHNRLITSCAIKIRPNDIAGYGHHRFGQGMVALDFDKGSTVNQKPGFAWDGLWTGVNPVQFASLTVDSEIRPLIISHDDDGHNRIYEFMSDDFSGSDKAEGTEKTIVSLYDLPHLFDQRDPTGKVVGKRLTGGRAEVSGVRGVATLEACYRPNYYPCWLPWTDPISVGADGSQLTEFTDQKPFYDILKWGAPDKTQCEEGSARLAHRASFFSPRIRVTGRMQVNQLQLSVEVFNEDDKPSCTDMDRDEKFEELITCNSPGLFDYKIVEKDGVVEHSDVEVIELAATEEFPEDCES